MNIELKDQTLSNFTPNFAPSTHLLYSASSQNIVSSFSLIGSDELRDVDGRPRLQAYHVGAQLLLKGPVQDLSPAHGISQIHGGDVPA